MTAAGSRESGSVALSELVSYLAEFLDIAEFEDYGPNGLQVDGSGSVEKIVTGVSGCVELFDRAEAAAANAIIVHHGLFWSNLSPLLIGSQYRRVARLVGSGVSLLAYHLPLDAHPSIGNNVLAAKGLGLEELGAFGWVKGRQIGCQGRFAGSLDPDALRARCRDLFGQEPLVLGDTAGTINSVAVVTGGGQSLLNEAIASGVDAFVTGEASEWVTHLARESGTCYVAAGHHATERLGVRALGEHLAERYGVEVEFIDVANPV